MDALRAVLSASATGSFSAAAEALNITYGAISRRVTAVEQWARMRLFERHGRGVRLTLQGEQLVEQIERALAILEDSKLARSRDQDVDIVRVGMVQSFARLWFVPHLRELEGTPSDLRIEPDIDDRHMTLSEARIAIRLGRGDWPEVNARRLFSERLIPYAAPALAAKVRKRYVPRDILNLPLIHDVSETNWRLWLASENVVYERRPQDRTVFGYDLALLMAAKEHGIALLRPPYGKAFAEELGLVAVSPRAVESQQAFYVLTKPGSTHSAAARLLDRLGSLAKRCYAG